MGQIANQALLEFLLGLKEKWSGRKGGKKEKSGDRSERRGNEHEKGKKTP